MEITSWDDFSLGVLGEARQESCWKAHGRILHGFQYVKSPKRAWPTTYDGPHSSAAVALKTLLRDLTAA
jgi:hypothetical protein